MMPSDMVCKLAFSMLGQLLAARVCSHLPNPVIKRSLAAIGRKETHTVETFAGFRSRCCKTIRLQVAPKKKAVTLGLFFFTFKNGFKASKFLM